MGEYACGLSGTAPPLFLCMRCLVVLVHKLDENRMGWAIMGKANHFWSIVHVH